MAVDNTLVNVHVYSSGNVTTSAYSTLVASTPVSVSKIQVLDTSGKILKLATGTSGNEKDFCVVPVSGIVTLPFFLPAGNRLSIIAVDANATTGYNVVSFLQ